MARQSYFAEKRGQNNDPMFFNRVPLEEIKKNVRRIIRDIKYDVIQPQDYNYFYSNQIIQACIAEAQENYASACVLCNALNFYINECLQKGIKPYPSVGITGELMSASAQQILQNSRARNWFNILQMFTAVYNGVDIQSALLPIKMIDGKEISNL